MSFRPTIAIYINGEISDIGYYRWWRTKNLFFEAIAYAALYHDCKTREEYLERAYHTQRIIYTIEPENFDNSPESLHFIEEHSECPIVVDLTLQNIYKSFGALSEENLALYHTPDNPYSFEEYANLKRFKEDNLSEYYIKQNYSDEKLKRDYELFIKYTRPLGTNANFSQILSYYRIPFGSLDMEEIKELLLEDDIIHKHCSVHMCKMFGAA